MSCAGFLRKKRAKKVPSFIKRNRWHLLPPLFLSNEPSPRYLWKNYNIIDCSGLHKSIVKVHVSKNEALNRKIFFHVVIIINVLCGNRFFHEQCRVR
jgi:hypothetical protein